MTNRIIKFRAWDKKEKEMREVAMLRWEDGRMSRIAGYWPTTRNNGWTDHDPAEDIYVLMQFTSLLDAKGREIYEGDIVGIKGRINKFYYVVFSRACFVLKEIIKDNDIRISMQDEYEMIIIGNIYENEDLLK